MYMDYYHAQAIRRLNALTKEKGSAMFIPKRSMTIKNKRRKNRR